MDMTDMTARLVASAVGGAVFFLFASYISRAQGRVANGSKTAALLALLMWFVYSAMTYGCFFAPEILTNGAPLVGARLGYSLAAGYVVMVTLLEFLRLRERHGCSAVPRGMSLGEIDPFGTVIIWMFISAAFYDRVFKAF